MNADLAVADLHEVVTTGLERGGHLLDAAELRVLDAVLALNAPAARLFARLSARKPDVFAIDALEVAGVDDLDAAIDELAAADLVDRDVPWVRRAERSTIEALQAGCRRLGLAIRGRRDELVARLRDRRDWDARRWIALRHRALIRRLERWTFLRLNPDRSAAIVERLGLVRWPTYATTAGALHPDRRALLRWEALVDALLDVDASDRSTMTATAAIAWLAEADDWPIGGLSPRRALVDVVLAEAQDLERAGRAASARALYERLAASGAVRPGDLGFRLARTWEADGDPHQGLIVLRSARPNADPVEAIAIARAERRVARSVGGGFAPDRPLASPAQRTVRIAPGPALGARPGWTVAGQVLPIEAAVVQTLDRLGRRALFAEGSLWTTLYALLFRDAYFLPIAGMLPVKRLSGPLDVGTRAFATRRAEAVGAVRAAVRAGEGPDRIRLAYARHAGEALAGASFVGNDGEALARVATDLGPIVVDTVLGRLLDEGWRSAAGLPDLVVLAGPAAVIDGFPTRIGPGAALVEIKGPTDAVRDAQAVWFDRLIAAGARVERWDVVPGSS